MDLPTCPSCGQSVLDDEPVSCPFCGAAMDGSSGPTRKTQQGTKKKPTAAAKKNPPADTPKRSPGKSAESTDSHDDDPFGIAEASPKRRAIAVAPKRTKSRPRLVICPMCDTKGYVPISAVGKNVKCRNPECMVPVFTAPVPDNMKKPERTHVNDQAEEQAAQLAAASSGKNPMMMYGVIGVVLLAAGAGLAWWLEAAPDTSALEVPIDINPNLVDAPDDTVLPEESRDPELLEPEVFDASAKIVQLADAMVQAARKSSNRDKALCRRHSGDAFLRAGEAERADKEFAQLLVVSRQRNQTNDYYRMTPRVQAYWRAVEAADAAGAETQVAALMKDAAKLRTGGSLAIEARIKWAAVLVHRGDIAAAQDLINKVQVDNSVVAQRDQQRQSVWFALARSAAEKGLPSETPFALHTVPQPAAVAVAEELVLQGQMQAAVSWVQAWDTSELQSVMVSRVCRMGLRTGVLTANTIGALQAEAGDTHQDRIAAISAEISQEQLQQTAARLLPATAPKPQEMPDVTQLVNYRAPKPAATLQRARLLTDLARSAAAQGSTNTAASAVIAAGQVLRSELPATADVRQASRFLDSSKGQLEDSLRSALSLNPAENVDREYRNYRRGLDRLATAAEERRLNLVSLLCPVVAADGGKSLAQALQQDPLLANELQLDPLCQLLAGVARLHGGTLPSLEAVTETRVPAGERTEVQPEVSLGPAWLKLTSAAQEAYERDLFESFQTDVQLPGLRACLRAKVAEMCARKSQMQILEAARSIATEVNRENVLAVAALWLTRGNHGDDVEAWAAEARLSPTALTQILSAIVAGLPAPAEEAAGI